jgi:hypothetical protein
MKLLAMLSLLGLGLIQSGCEQSDSGGADDRLPVLFAVYAGSEIQLTNATRLVRSLRKFGGAYKDAPVWLYLERGLAEGGGEKLERLAALSVTIKTVTVPEAASWYFLSGMVFAAAAAEKEAAGSARIVVFLGSDTIILQQPDEFILPEGKCLGYRPVMHRNISPLLSEELDSYWSRAYEIMRISPAAVFPMATPADSDVIRPYFNASCLAARPEIGLFSKWSDTYLELCADSTLKAESMKDQPRRIFTFQVALIGAVLNNCDKSDIVEISDRYNYPIFFREMYGAKYDFHDITEAVTIRYESFFDRPVPDWERILKGPADRIAWIKEMAASP